MDSLCPSLCTFLLTVLPIKPTGAMEFQVQLGIVEFKSKETREFPIAAGELGIICRYNRKPPLFLLLTSMIHILLHFIIT